MVYHANFNWESGDFKHKTNQLQLIKFYHLHSANQFYIVQSAENAVADDILMDQTWSLANRFPKHHISLTFPGLILFYQNLKYSIINFQLDGPYYWNLNIISHANHLHSDCQKKGVEIQCLPESGQ